MKKNKRELGLIFGIIFSVSGLLAMFYPYRNITSFDFKAINEILERLAVLNLFGMFFAAVGLYMLYHLIKPPTLYKAKVIKLGQEYIDGKVVEKIDLEMNFLDDYPVYSKRQTCYSYEPTFIKENTEYLVYFKDGIVKIIDFDESKKYKVTTRNKNASFFLFILIFGLLIPFMLFGIYLLIR